MDPNASNATHYTRFQLVVVNLEVEVAVSIGCGFFDPIFCGGHPLFRTVGGSRLEEIFSKVGTFDSSDA
jgi:hypothetical protein